MKKFSTSTVLENGELVPWLAAKGELSYSPENPPDRDYYFQYSWVFPEILNPEVNLRRHFWFGEPNREDSDVKFLFAFWNSARRRDIDQIFLANGKPGESTTAPVGIYRHKSIYSFKEDSYVFIQHGSYLLIDVSAQSNLENGEIVLYRGIQKADEFQVYRLVTPEIRSKLMNVHAAAMADSATSFITVHSNVCRSETTYLKDRTMLLRSMALSRGLEAKSDPVFSLLYSGYALEDWCGINKFGPNYVKFRTPVTNIRITTFIANETEVKVIDPNKLEVVEAKGCKVKEIEV